MSNVDPDIVSALKMIAGGEESPRVKAVRAKHDKQLEQHIETQLHMLSDEVSKVIPVTHPLFEQVLMLTLLRKLEKRQQAPEFKSFLEDFPQGW
jgi:hypothetical protein